MTLSAMRKTYSSRLWVSYQPTNEVAPSKPTPHFSTKPTFFSSFQKVLLVIYKMKSVTNHLCINLFLVCLYR